MIIPISIFTNVLIQYSFSRYLIMAGVIAGLFKIVGRLMTNK